MFTSTMPQNNTPQNGSTQNGTVREAEMLAAIVNSSYLCIRKVKNPKPQNFSAKLDPSRSGIVKVRCTDLG